MTVLRDKAQAQGHAAWLNEEDGHPYWMIQSILSGDMDTPATDANDVPNLAASLLYDYDMNKVMGIHRIVERHHKEEWMAREREFADWMAPGTVQLLFFEEEEE